jgi:hypothetical protein
VPVSQAQRERYAQKLRDAMQDAFGCVTYARLALAAHEAKIGSCDVLLFQHGLAPLNQVEGMGIRFIFVYQPMPSALGTYAGITMKVARYYYDLVRDERRDIVKYHYHPPGSEREGDLPGGDIVPYPHIHILSDEIIGGRTFDRHHLPTGAVPPTEFVRMLIEQLEVPPNVVNWRERLADIGRRYFTEPFWSIDLGRL